MNYYIQGDAANAERIRAAFEKLGYDTSFVQKLSASDSHILFTLPCDTRVHAFHTAYIEADILKRLVGIDPDYKELELPVQPKFKAEDRIVSKSDKSTIYRIITLHEERREYIVEIEHKDYHESCPWIAFEDQDDYELAPKPHYDIKNFKPFDKVLVRRADDEEWAIEMFSKYYDSEPTIHGRTYRFMCIADSYTQCIPFEGNEHLLGTTDMPSEEYINW